ncbi:MAG TPA: ATP-dependent DNA ligase [Candidatus Polarisedimenticolia bacterium]|nr:ATP-dependent DNA ligase [Candidatus Polarisedimenticolia bacterium]
MLRFAQTGDAVAATTKKLQKTAMVAEYLKSRTLDESAVSAVFLSGSAFAAGEETTLQIGGSILWRVVAELSGRDESALTAAYRKYGDLGAVAGEMLAERSGQGLTILEVDNAFRQIAAARGSTAKAVLVRDLLQRARPLEAKYITKIMTGDLRIGLKESLVEEAIAKAYDAPLAEVQRANMLLGDIGETLRSAVSGQLAEAKMRLFHPLGFMLASPIESPEQGLSYFAEAAVEDKYDGIRAQAHVSESEVKFFSRTRDEITASFPELPGALLGLPRDAVLDGEIVAWEYPQNLAQTQEVVDELPSEAVEMKAADLGRARPFGVLQQRLGRKKVHEKMLREIPVAYLVFDILYVGGELLIHRPLRERALILDALLAGGRKVIHHRVTEAQRKIGTQGKLTFDGEEEISTASIIRAPVFLVGTPAELEDLFVAARARGNEGLMIKDLASPYAPGKRGKSWLKMKRELATLDVVVTAVEYGHGKRIGVLSDYTFAVWDTNKDRLVNIGKAYSGLTDAEIAEMTKWFVEHTIEGEGFRRTVEPKIVLEVAFNNMMRSDRHDSGYALRFPRILRLRPDKTAAEADTIERVREIYENQKQ